MFNNGLLWQHVALDLGVVFGRAAHGPLNGLNIMTLHKGRHPVSGLKDGVAVGNEDLALAPNGDENALSGQIAGQLFQRFAHHPVLGIEGDLDKFGAVNVAQAHTFGPVLSKWESHRDGSADTRARKKRARLITLAETALITTAPK